MDLYVRDKAFGSNGFWREEDGGFCDVNEAHTHRIAHIIKECKDCGCYSNIDDLLELYVSLHPKPIILKDFLKRCIPATITN